MKKLFYILLCIVNISDVIGSVKDSLNKDLIPHPIYSCKPEFVDLYWKAWEIAWDRVRYQNGIVQSPYMDENLWDDTIWIWDTEFMCLFCKYSPTQFPGIESLDNFYEPMLNGKKSTLRIQHPDNPPFYSWIEYEYYKMTGDKERLKKVLLDERYLQRYYYLFDSFINGYKFDFDHAEIVLEKTPMGYRWGDVQSGMDNTPRGRDCNGNMLWMDALAQQALSALYIKRLAQELGDKRLEKEFSFLYNKNKELLNKYYWNAEDGFYYDISEEDVAFVKVRTPAVYWAMLAEVPDKKQAKQLASYAIDSYEFGGKYPWPSLSRSDKEYNDETGDYWRGSIWIPLAYMATKALETYGYCDIAYDNAYNLLLQMYETYKCFKPSTIWECYSPSAPRPSERLYATKRELVRPDFCGWSALAPISLFIENILGFCDIDANKRVVEWQKKGAGKQGIKNLRFGDIIADIVADDMKIYVCANNPFTLIVNGKKYEIKKGEQIICVE